MPHCSSSSLSISCLVKSLSLSMRSAGEGSSIQLPTVEQGRTPAQRISFRIPCAASAAAWGAWSESACVVNVGGFAAHPDHVYRSHSSWIKRNTDTETQTRRNIEQTPQACDCVTHTHSHKQTHTHTHTHTHTFRERVIVSHTQTLTRTHTHTHTHTHIHTHTHTHTESAVVAF